MPYVSQGSFANTQTTKIPVSASKETPYSLLRECDKASNKVNFIFNNILHLEEKKFSELSEKEKSDEFCRARKIFVKHYHPDKWRDDDNEQDAANKLLHLIGENQDKILGFNSHSANIDPNKTLAEWAQQSCYQIFGLRKADYELVFEEEVEQELDIIKRFYYEKLLTLYQPKNFSGDSQKIAAAECCKILKNNYLQIKKEIIESQIPINFGSMSDQSALYLSSKKASEEKFFELELFSNPKNIRINDDELKQLSEEKQIKKMTENLEQEFKNYRRSRYEDFLKKAEEGYNSYVVNLDEYYKKYKEEKNINNDIEYKNYLQSQTEKQKKCEIENKKNMGGVSVAKFFGRLFYYIGGFKLLNWAEKKEKEIAQNNVIVKAKEGWESENNKTLQSEDEWKQKNKFNNFQEFIAHNEEIKENSKGETILKEWEEPSKIEQEVAEMENLFQKAQSHNNHLFTFNSLQPPQRANSYWKKREKIDLKCGINSLEQLKAIKSTSKNKSLIQQNERLAPSSQENTYMHLGLSGRF